MIREGLQMRNAIQVAVFASLLLFQVEAGAGVGKVVCGRASDWRGPLTTKEKLFEKAVEDLNSALALIQVESISQLHVDYFGDFNEKSPANLVSCKVCTPVVLGP